MTELLHTTPLIVRRHREPPGGLAAGPAYELFDPQWRLVGSARQEEHPGGGRRLLRALLPWAPSRLLTVYDAAEQPVLGIERRSGRRSTPARVTWADGTPLGVFRRSTQPAGFDLVDSHGRALGRVDLRPPAEAPPRIAEGSASTMIRSVHRIVGPDDEELATVTREFLPNKPGRYPPHLLTYTLRLHRDASSSLGALLRLTPMVTDTAGAAA